MRWTEIEQSDRWKTLTADQRRVAREKYFDEFVAPGAPERFDPNELRAKWMQPYAGESAPEPTEKSFLESAADWRSPVTVVTDAVKGGVSTVANAAGSVARLTNKKYAVPFGAEISAVGGLLGRAGMQSAQDVSDALEAGAQPATDFGEDFADSAGNVAQAMNEGQSWQRQEAKREMSEAMGGGILSAAKHAFLNPLDMSETAAESLPLMGAGKVAATAATALTGTARVAVPAMLASEGAISAVSSADQARQAIQSLPAEQLQALPDYAALAEKYGDAGARKVLEGRAMSQSGFAAVVLQTLTAGATRKLSAVEEAFTGTGAPARFGNRPANAAYAMAKEAPQEGLQGGAETLASNFGTSAVDPSVGLLDNVGASAVMEAGAGMPIAGVVGALQTPAAAKGASDTDAIFKSAGVGNSPVAKPVADANLGLVVPPVDGYADEDAKLDALLASREAESAVAIPGGGSEVVAAVDAQSPLAADPKFGSSEPDLTAEAYDRARRDIRRSETVQRAESGVPVEQVVPQAPQVTVVQPQDSLRSRRDAARARNDFSAYLDEHGVDMAESDRLSNFDGDRIPQPSGEPVTVGESRISGKGIIATAPIVKPITLFDTTMAGTGRTDAGRFVNHSPQPNADVKLVQGRIIAVPNRPIESGQEVTINYREIDPIREQFAKSQYVPEPTPVNPTDYRSTAQADPEKNPEAFGLPKPLKPRRLKRTPADFDENYDDAMDFLALNGGLNRKAWASEGVDPDMLTRKKGNNHQRRFGLGPTLFPASGGMTPSEAREKLQGMGFLAADPDNATATIEDDDAVQMVMESINQGRKFLLPAGAEVEQRAADITRMADSASRDVKVMDELGLKDRDIDEANEFDNRERIQFSQPEDRARQIGTRIALDALKEFRAGDIDASALSDLLDSEELAVARRSGQGEPKATGNVTQDVRAKWDDRSRRFGLSNTLQRATEDVAGAFLGREFGESSDSFYGRDESARALRDWLNEKRGVEFSQPSSADTSNPRGEGVGFAHGQEALASRLVQWSSALRLGRAGPRPMEQRPESIGAVNRNAAGAAEQGDATREAIREQSARLIEQAKAGGYYWPNGSQILAEIGKLQTLGGAEHQVFLAGDVDSGNGFVIRATDNGFFGPRSDISPAQYLARLDDYSATFPDLQTRLIGISESPDIPGHAVIWSAQPFVRGKKFRNQRELAEAMAAHGWDVDGNEGEPRFIHRENGAIIEDAHTDNVFHDDNGNLYPFDVVVEALPRQSADGGKVYPRTRSVTDLRNDPQYSQSVGRKVASPASSASDRQAPSPSGIPRGLDSKPSLATNRLSNVISKFLGKPYRAEQVVLPDAVSGPLQDFGRLFGRSVVVFRTKDGRLNANGLVLGDGSIYVNENAQSPALTVASHELLHEIRKSRPELYDFIRKEVEKRADFAKWKAEIDSRELTKGDNRLSDDKVMEELVADSFGDALTDPEFLAALAKRNPSKFRQFVMSALDFFRDIAKKMGKVKSLGSHEYLRDVEGLRDAYAQMLDDFTNGVMPTESDGIVKFQSVRNDESGTILPSSSSAQLATRVNASANEDQADGLVRDAEVLSDFSQSLTLGKHPFSDVEVPRQRMVLAAMGRVLQDLKIRDRVIQAIPVDVVNMLAGRELSPDVLFNNESMLFELLVAKGKQAVPARINSASATMRGVALAATEEIGSRLREKTVLGNGLAAGSAVGRKHATSIPYSEEAIGTPEPQFSQARSDKKNERDLVITHNLSEEKLAHALRMGGLAVPSLAITKGDQALTGFGDITLIGDRDLADPKSGAKAFGADIYSPRYPDVLFKLDKRAMTDLMEILKPYREPGARTFVDTNNAAEWLRSDDAFRKYLAETGEDGGGYSDLRAGAEKLLRKVGATEHIFDGFTNSGNRRYKPHDLETVVKILKKELRGGENFNYGVGSLRAKYTPQFKSVDQIKKNKGSLVTHEQFEAIKKEIDDEFFGLVEQLRPHSSRAKEFGFADTIIGVMEDAAKMGVPRALAEYGIKDVSPETQRSIAAFLGKLRNLPTEYFEVKHLRPVGIHEFRAAVVPSGTSDQVRGTLRKRGLDVVEYPRNNEAARRAVIKQVSESGGLMFSQPNTPAQSRDLAGNTPDELAALESKVRVNAAKANSAIKRSVVGAAVGAQQPVTFTYTDRFEGPIRGRLNKLREWAQDKMLSALFVQEDIKAVRGAIADAVNVYRRENLMHGRTGDQLETLKRTHVDPLVKAMKAEGLDDAVVEDYLEAKFAPERNKIIAAKNPNMPDGGSGMTDAEAADFLAGKTDGFRSGRKITPADTAKLQRIATKIQALRAETLDRLESSGLINAQAKAAMLAQAPNYVPLRGKDGAEITGGRGGAGKGIDVRGKPIKEALGRGAGNRAVNILAEMIADAERSIVQAEKNRVGKTLARLVLENPNKDLWEVEPVRLEQKLDSVGQVYQAVQSNAQDQDAIRIMHDGKPYFVRLSDPKLRDAMKNLGVDNSGAVIKFMGGINRYFSAVLTRYNPSFIAVNALRDLGFGMTGIAAEHGAKIAAKAAASYPAAMRAMWRDSRGQKPSAPVIVSGSSGTTTITKPSDKMLRYAREFSEAGGKTFFAKRDSVEEISSKVAAEFKSYGKLLRRGQVGLAWNKAVNNSALLKVVNDANDTVENAMRLSAYAALRESGKSVEQAAEYAKNITVNFNRKGQAAAGINAVILFYNAATQGAHRSILLLKNPKVMAAVGGMAGLQALLAAYAMGADDEDEDGLTAWEKIPDYEKERNLIIPIVGHDANGKRRIRMVKWPMPYGFNVFTYAGGKMAELGMSKEPKPTKFANDMGGAVVNAFSPIKFIDGMDGIKPHFMKIFDALGANKDDLGFPIRDENHFAPFEEPRASMGKADTPEAYKAAAKALNRLGGGDEVTPPKIMRGLLDWAPEDLEYLTEQLTGGIGRFASDSYGVGEKLFAGIDTNPKDYPILRSLVSEVDTNRATAGIYYDRKETIEREKARLKLKFKEDGLAAARTIVSETPALQGFRLKRFKSTGKYTDKAGNVELEAATGSLANAYKAAEKRVKDLNAQIREAQAASYPSLKAKVEKIRGLQAEREKAQSEFNAVYAKRRQ